MWRNDEKCCSPLLCEPLNKLGKPEFVAKEEKEERGKRMTEERQREQLQREKAAGRENAAEAHGILAARPGGKLTRKARRTEWF